MKLFILFIVVVLLLISMRIKTDYKDHPEWFKDHDEESEE